MVRADERLQRWGRLFLVLMKSGFLAIRGIATALLLFSCAACFVHPVPAPVPPPPPISVNYVEKLTETEQTWDMLPVIMQDMSRQATENIPCRDMTNLSIDATRIISESHQVGAVVQQQSNFNVDAEESYLTCDSLPQ